jgi:EF-P beta-lysylation protein EpmB
MHASTSKQLWQEALSDLITDPKELLDILELDPSLLSAAREAASKFPLKVTRPFVARMEKGNPYDPLLKQVLPLGIELSLIPGYSVDPLQEKHTNPVPGLLHKYVSRVLVTLTSACAIHCRYCFRRHFPYAENNPGRLGWEKIFNYIKQDTAISEVILSGGDPLSVNDGLLRSFSENLDAIHHVKILRIHTRLLVVLPERMTDELISWIKQLKQRIVIVIHANHPREIDSNVQKALQQLRIAGAHLLNQSVLLKGVNDDLKTLTALSEVLFSADVLPYYLHVLDKVQGAAHFDLPLEEAQRLHRELVKTLPGYLVPRLVREDAGEVSKTII